MKKLITLKKASEILNIPIKTIYSRINLKKYKDCFIKIKKRKRQRNYIFYKTSCINKELKNKVTQKDIINFTNLYFEILEFIKKKKNISDDLTAEKILRKIIRNNINKISFLKNKKDKKIYKITECQINKKKELEEIILFFNLIKNNKIKF
jgi:hypothetical protein